MVVPGLPTGRMSMSHIPPTLVREMTSLLEIGLPLLRISRSAMAGPDNKNRATVASTNRGMRILMGLSFA